MTLRVSTAAPRDSSGALAVGARRLTAQFRRIPPLFVWMVLVPGALVSVYCLFLASPVYISRAQFIVRESQGPQLQPGGGSGASALLQGIGLAPAATDSFVVQDYIMSRDAIGALVDQHHLREDLGRSGLDFLMGFPHPFETPSMEHLADAYPRFVSVDYSSTTGVSTLEVKAFRPQDAQELAQALLAGGEVVVNHLNDRADQDAIAETRRQITEAESDLGVAEDQLTGFRNRERLIDPKESSVANLDILGHLQADLATLQAERAGIAATAPQSPELAGLDSRIGAYQQQAQDQQAKMAGQADSLAPMIGEYERLSLERDFQDKRLATAAEAAEQARIEARRKRLYLERVSSPNLPDAPSEPDRLKNLGVALVTLFMAYGGVALFFAGFREHQAR